MTVTGDWQVEYGGLLVDGNAYSLASLPDGLMGGVTVRTSDDNRTARHGMFAGRDLRGGRTIVVQVEIAAPGDAAAFATLVAGFAAAFAPGQSEGPFGFQVPGIAGGSSCVVYARPRRIALPVDLSYYNKIPIATVELFATDPLLYSAAATTAGIAITAAAGGFVWPFPWPLVWIGASATAVVVTNAGTAAVEPLVRFRGPLLNPKITNVNVGLTFGLGLSIDPGDYVDVDMANRTVLLNGTANRYPSITTAGWWSLLPGNNSITLAADGGTGTADLTWRSAWL